MLDVSNTISPYPTTSRQFIFPVVVAPSRVAKVILRSNITNRLERNRSRMVAHLDYHALLSLGNLMEDQGKDSAAGQLKLASLIAFAHTEAT